MRRLRCGDPALSYIPGPPRRDKNRCRGVWRNCEVQREPAGIPLPFGRDRAANRIVTSLDPGEIADDGGTDHNFLEARGGRIRRDAGEVMEEPFVDLAEHEVIL